MIVNYQKQLSQTASFSLSMNQLVSSIDLLCAKSLDMRLTIQNLVQILF
jgi:hypothetical protein